MPRVDSSTALWDPLRPLPLAAIAMIYFVLAIPAAADKPMPASAAAVSLMLAAVLIVLSLIDLKTFRLPDSLTLPLIAAGILTAAYLGSGTVAWRTISAAIGFASAYGVAKTYEAVRGRSGLGLGDVKLYAAAGAWVGGEGLITVLLYACCTALLAITASRQRHGGKAQGTDAIPFGPFLAAGIWLVWLYGPIN